MLGIFFISNKENRLWYKYIFIEEQINSKQIEALSSATNSAESEERKYLIEERSDLILGSRSPQPTLQRQAKKITQSKKILS